MAWSEWKKFGAELVLISESYNFKADSEIDIKNIYADYNNITLENFLLKNVKRTGGVNQNTPHGDYSSTLNTLKSYDASTGILYTGRTASAFCGAEMWVIADIYIIN